MISSVSSVTPSSLFGPILPDEMIWSYFARFLAQFPTLSLETMSGLLGGEYPSHRKTFPTRLANLAAAFAFSSAPTVESLIRDHTFFPFAQPEISVADGERLVKTMSVDAFPVGAPDGLLLPADFRLRGCLECLATDVVPYRRRCHQVPLLRICTIHKTPLIETEIRAGTQEPVAAPRVLNGLPFVITDAKGQDTLAAAYKLLVTCATNTNVDQVRHEFSRTLQRHGHFSHRQVRPALTELLHQTYHPETLAAVGLMDHSGYLSDWLTVPKIALVLAATGEEFGQFLLRSAKSEPPVLWAKRRQAGATREHSLANKVEEFAPQIVACIRAEFPFRRVTRWSLATELNRFLGASFASNYSYKREVAHKLDRYVETDESYASRVMDGIAENPTLCKNFQSVSAFMGMLGLKRYMRRNPDMAKRARRIFKGAHGQGST